MKHYTSIFALGLSFIVAFINPVFGQKAKLDDFKVKALFLQLPSKPLPSHINTYHVDVLTDELTLPTFSSSAAKIRQDIVIPGYKRLDNAGVKVDVKIELPTASNIKVVTEDKKDKDGKTWKEYYRTGSFSGTMVASIKDDKGVEIGSYSKTTPEIMRTNSHQSVVALDKSEDAGNFAVNGRIKIFNAMMADINAFLKSNYGILEDTDKVEFYSVKENSHADAGEFMVQKAKVEEAFAAMTAKDNAKYISLIKPCIDVWTKLEAKYGSTDKNEQKLKYASQINLARAYFWMEDFDNAKKYATLVMNGDVDSKDGKKLLSAIDEVQKKLEVAKRKSRHFSIEVSETEISKSANAKEEKAAAIRSGDITQLPDFNRMMGVETTSKIYPGQIKFRDGNLADGYFVFESTSNIPEFKYPNNIKFGMLKNGALERVQMNGYEKFEHLVVDNVKYEVKDLTVGTGILKVSMKNGIVQTLRSYNKTTLVVVHPPMATSTTFGNTNELSPDIFVYDISKKSYLATDGLRGFTKTMKSIVETCPAAVDYLTTAKKEGQTQSLFAKALGFDNYPIIEKALELYDTCK